MPTPPATLAAARVGLALREAHGAPPRDPDAMARWLRHQYRIHVGYFTGHLARIAGAWQALRQPGTLAGMIMLQPDLPYPRWTLAHEWGHYATGAVAGHALRADGKYHANLPEERAANACAVAWLMPADELRRMWLEDWRRAEIARWYGVPEHAVMLRRLLMADLGELAPLLDAAEHGLLPADDWDPA